MAKLLSSYRDRSNDSHAACSICHLTRLVSPAQVFSASVQNYKHIINAAVRHGEAATAWAFYDELLEKGMSPNNDIWNIMFQGAKCQPEQQEKLLGILHYMRNNQVYPRDDLANSIKDWFQR